VTYGDLMRDGDGPTEIIGVHGLQKGDFVQIGASSGNDGTFVVTGVDTGRGASRTTVVRLRNCPECSTPYGDLHPESECLTGTVERIMES